jgi:hypothetical protein
LAQLLPRFTMSLNVLRATVLLIGLTIAAGPTADLLCAIWCHPVEGTALTCLHRETTTPRATRSNDCDEVTLRTIAFTREDVRRGPAVPDTHGAGRIPRFAIAPSVRDDCGIAKPAGGLALEARCLMRPLRI